MEVLYFRIAVFLGLLAGAVIFALPLRRQLSDFHEFVRRTPKWRRAFLALLAAAWIAYGGGKTNRVGQTSGTNEVEIVGGGVGGGGQTNLLTCAFGLQTEGDLLCPPPPLFSPSTVTPADIARGWQLVGVDTNAAADFTMPEVATLASNWWVRGAYEDCSIVRLNDCSIGCRANQSNNLTIEQSEQSNNQNNRTIEQSEQSPNRIMSFPFGTNTCSSLWAFSWGKVRFRFDDTNEIVAVGSPMAAVPYRSRLWALETDDAFLVTWENFVLNRDTDTPVSAQVELRRSGDFVTRSNEVETICRRVCPEDWDDDGIPNVSDPCPCAYDGDFFGPRQTLPEGANANAYCWVDIAADANARVTFAGDGESDLPDPDFMLRAGETNRVTLLIGKTYAVESSQPLTVTGRSDDDIRVRGNGSRSLTVVWPVSVCAMEGNGASFLMRVVPDSIGGEFEWNDCCCPITGSGRSFSWECDGLCLCTGCISRGSLVYEGYSIPVTGGHCGCSHGPRPIATEPDDEQIVAGVSASFSPEAVIFEDAYTNMPGVVVGRRSTEAVLSCSVHGGFRGGTATFSFAGETNLVWIRGAAVPHQPVTVPPGERLKFAAVYKGLLPSAEAEDVTYTVTFTENGTTNAPTVAEARLTSVKVQLRALNSAQSNPNENRHAFGVHEWVDFFSFPHSEALVLQILSADEDLIGADNEMFFCPWQGGSYRLRIVARGATYDADLSVIEPEVVCRDVWWNDIGVLGMAGLLDMRLALYVEPTYVSFKNLYMEEIPDDDPCPRFGYFSTGPLAKTGALSHSLAAHAGVWGAVKGDGSWMADRVGRETAYPQPWSDGWKEWRIPVGWGDYLRNVKGRILPNPTSQRFELDADGTARIMKYNHVLTRTPSNDVWLDGVRQR